MPPGGECFTPHLHTDRVNGLLSLDLLDVFLCEQQPLLFFCAAWEAQPFSFLKNFEIKLSMVLPELKSYFGVWVGQVMGFNPQ